MSLGFSALLVAASVLRVCADPNNLPYSNAHGAGFENRIAELVARDLGRRLVYEWRPQRRGFIRETLKADRCDLVMSVPGNALRSAKGLPERSAPDRFQGTWTTTPYYRSTYVFVSKRANGPGVASLDDPRLRTLRIGIQITGNDYNNPPAAQALAERKLASNVRGYTVYGDYAQAEPQRAILDAVARGDVDTAIVWGPLAGYYADPERVGLRTSRATLSGSPLRIAPVSPSSTFVFDIAMATRRDDRELHDAVNRVIARRRSEIRRILQEYGVPLV